MDGRPDTPINDLNYFKTNAHLLLLLLLCVLCLYINIYIYNKYLCARADMNDTTMHVLFVLLLLRMCCLCPAAGHTSRARDMFRADMDFLKSTININKLILFMEEYQTSTFHMVKRCCFETPTTDDCRIGRRTTDSPPGPSGIPDSQVGDLSSELPRRR